MGGVYGGTSWYADDLKLLTPSAKALRISGVRCKKYDKKYVLLFNDKKSMLIRELHVAAKQLQSSLTCRDVVKKKNVVIQTVKVIPSSNLRPRWRTMEVGGGGGIPQNESEAVEYLKQKMLL